MTLRAAEINLGFCPASTDQEVIGDPVFVSGKKLLGQE
jgi:hypothetical protein